MYIMNANGSTIKNLISGSNKVFVIPSFQRNYEWTQEQCDELFSDIKKVAKKDVTQHYLGNIVYYESMNTYASYTELVLVDGQQRITSLLLLVCAIRDSIEDEDEKTEINNSYLINTNKKHPRMRLKQNEYDAGAFEAIVEGNKVAIDSFKDSNVCQNYWHFRELLEDEQPNQIMNALAYLQIVDLVFKIDEDLTPIQTIFEKMNSTGKPLSLADLARNHLLVSGSTADQTQLYKDYWINIEQNLGSDNISRFVKDYLIMKMHKDVNDKKAYQKFKEYVKNSGKSNREVLTDMLEYSVYYKYLRFFTSPNAKLNRLIKMLDALKTSDVYPLYMSLLKQLSGDQSGAIKIFSLLKDFMLRYRIVLPTAGGSGLRDVTYNLLRKLDDAQIKCDYDSILFELSNSATETSRFPDDDEFTKALKRSSMLNYKYARVLFLTIEESETKNKPADPSDITIEHIMPQKLSAKWVNDLGGKENADRVYDLYINSIGNLAPMSRGYNAKLSNNAWSKKRADLKKVQFSVTTEVAQNEKWTEDEIKKRADDLALRACKAVTAPQERTRPFERIIEAGKDYPASIDQFQLFKNRKPSTVSIDGQTYEVDAWADYLSAICKALYAKDPKKFKQMVDKNTVHKSSSNRNPLGKDPVISEVPSLLMKPKLIEVSSSYYHESCFSSDSALRYGAQLLDEFGLLQSTTFTIKGSDDDDEDDEE